MDLLKTQDGSQVSFSARDTSTNVSPGVTGAAAWATDGNPAIPQAATQFPAFHYNGITGSLYNLLMATTGLTPNIDDYTQIYQAILSMARLVDTGSLNALAAAPPNAFQTSLPSLSAMPDGFTLKIIPAYSNTSTTPTFAFNGGSAVTIVRPDGSPLQPGDISAGFPAELMKVGGGSPIWWLSSVNQYRLGANKTFYVNASTGSDTTGNGSSGAPWASLQNAVNQISRLNFNGWNITISFTGAFTAGCMVTGLFAGQTGPASLTFSSTGTTSVTCAAGYGPCFGANQGAQYTLSVASGTLTLEAGGTSVITGDNLYSAYNSILVLGSSGVNFQCNGNHAPFCATSGAIILSAGNNYTITSGGGGIQAIWFQFSGGIISDTGGTVTMVGNTAINNATCVSENGGQAALFGKTFGGSGGAVGVRYGATNLALINTQGGGASYLPGSSAGSYSGGAEYV